MSHHVFGLKSPHVDHWMGVLIFLKMVLKNGLPSMSIILWDSICLSSLHTRVTSQKSASFLKNFCQFPPNSVQKKTSVITLVQILPSRFRLRCISPSYRRGWICDKPSKATRYSYTSYNPSCLGPCPAQLLYSAENLFMNSAPVHFPALAYCWLCSAALQGTAGMELSGAAARQQMGSLHLGMLCFLHKGYIRLT